METRQREYSRSTQDFSFFLSPNIMLMYPYLLSFYYLEQRVLYLFCVQHMCVCVFMCVCAYRCTCVYVWVHMEARGWHQDAFFSCLPSYLRRMEPLTGSRTHWFSLVGQAVSRLCLDTLGSQGCAAWWGLFTQMLDRRSKLSSSCLLDKLYQPSHFPSPSTFVFNYLFVIALLPRLLVRDCFVAADRDSTQHFSYKTTLASYNWTVKT